VSGELTAAEALRQLRLLLADQLRRPPGDIDWAVVGQMLYDVKLVAEDGWAGGVIELRIKRYRRRARFPVRDA
jgi:hypothetical protein